MYSAKVIFIFDIEYDHRYYLDPLKFPSNKISIGTYYFRISVENAKDKSATIKLTVNQNDIAKFKVNFSSFYECPTDSEILNGINNTEVELSLKYINNKFTNFEFKAPEIKKETKTTYFVITIESYEALDFLTVFVYPKSGHDSITEYTIYNINYMKEEILNKTALNQHKGGFVFLLENEEIKKIN